MKVVLVILATVMLVSGAVYYGEEMVVKGLDYLTPAQQQKTVPTLRLEKTPFRLTVPASGEVVGFQTTPIITPRVRRGNLTIGWLIEEGSLVQVGDVVVEFDETEAQIALEESDNEYTSFRYRIEQTQETSRGEMEVLSMDQEAAQVEVAYAQGQIRKDEDIFSRWEIQESLMSAALAEFREETVTKKGTLQEDVSKSDLKILDIDKQKAEVEIEMARDTLAKMSLVAPTEGVVIYQRWGFNTLEVGTSVYQGQQLMEIASTRQFRGIVQVVESDIAGVQAGKPVEIELEAFPEVKLSGTVDQVAKIARQIDREDPRKYFECSILIDVPLEMMSRFKPGMSLLAEIEIKRGDNGLIVPKSAVIKKETSFVVFLREKDDYREQPVEILASDHGFYEIGGLEEGAVVCLQHPFESRQLVLPDFSAPRASTQRQRFVVFFD